MHDRTAEFVERVSERHGLEATVEEFPEGTKTAADAATAIGCDVGAIASSLVFAVDGGPSPVVVVTSGASSVDEAALADHLGAEAARMADPETVAEATGWSIGGVPPLCHDTDLPVYFDPRLTEYDRVWAAAGTPTAVFSTPPDRLRELADAEVAPVTTD